MTDPDASTNYLTSERRVFRVAAINHSSNCEEPMNAWILGFALLTAPSAPALQDSCPSGRPARLVANVIPAVGQSPMWAATGGKPLTWDNAATPIRVLWLRDANARGPIFLSGGLAGKEGKGAPLASFATSLYGSRQPRLTLDQIGDKPAGIKDADLKKYAFHWTFVWFPGPGCYAMVGSVGSQKSVIHLNVAPSGKKGT
jgi:hypothetical protein